MKKIWEFIKSVWPFARTFICMDKEEGVAMFDYLNKQAPAGSPGTGAMYAGEPFPPKVRQFYERLKQTIEQDQ